MAALILISPSPFLKYVYYPALCLMINVNPETLRCDRDEGERNK